MKLQDAFFAERNIAGSWKLIGYKDPSGSSTGGSTTNFTYSTDLSDSANAAVDGAWKAKNNTQLNDCASGDNWTIKVTPTAAATDAAASITFEASVTGDGCEALTPTFKTIGK